MATTESERNVRILIVEDNDFLAVDLEMTLTELGHVTWVAATVAAALNHIAEHALDAAVLDVSLGGGEPVFGVAEALAKAGVSFIFLTGRSKHYFPERFRKVPVLSKPYDLQQLLAALRAVSAPSGTRRME